MRRAARGQACGDEAGRAATQLGALRPAAVAALATLIDGDLPRAERLLDAAGSLWHLRHEGGAALLAGGLPAHLVARVLAALELGFASAVAPPRAAVLETPRQAYEWVAPWLVGQRRERFVVVVLDVKHRPLHTVVVAEGSVDSCPVDPRAVFEPALREQGSAVLVAHNHPSGDPEPSAQDLALTVRLATAGEALGLPLVDHVIVGEAERYVSLAEHGVSCVPETRPRRRPSTTALALTRSRAGSDRSRR